MSIHHNAHNSKLSLSAAKWSYWPLRCKSETASSGNVSQIKKVLLICQHGHIVTLACEHLPLGALWWLLPRGLCIVVYKLIHWQHKASRMLCGRPKRGAQDIWSEFTFSFFLKRCPKPDSRFTLRLYSPVQRVSSSFQEKLKGEHNSLKCTGANKA